MAKTKSKKTKKECPPDKVFYVCNGQVLKNIDEMLYALQKMDDGAFRHHVHDGKNDFSNWLKDVFKEVELAEKIKKVMDKNHIVEIVKTSGVASIKK